HLAVNMYSLYVLGKAEEGMWGRLRFLFLYFLSGLAGSCAMVISNPKTFGAGASGAIWGLMTAYGTWVILNRKYIGRAASSWLRNFAVIILLNIFISSMPGISAAAHFGGGAAGVLIAFLLLEERFHTGPRRWLALAGLAAIPVVCFGALLQTMRVDPHWRQMQMTEEKDNWERHARPQIVHLWHDAIQIDRQEIQELRDRQKKKPTVQTLEKLTDAIRRARTKLQEGIALLKNAGPIGDEQQENERFEYLGRFEKSLQRLDQLQQEVEADAEKLKAK